MREPRHLEVVSLKENILRGLSAPAQNKRKTHCKRGHKFNKKNTLKIARGERVCRQCKRERERKHAA